MTNLRRWHQQRVRAARERRVPTRATQIDRSTVPVTVSDGDETRTVEAPVPDVLQEGVRAGEQADAAVDLATEAESKADAAAAEAALAKTTADGRNRIYAQQIEPVTMPEVPFVPGDLWYRLDTSGRISEVRVWNGSLWNPYQIVAGSILVPGSVGNVLIADGAMDAKTITGATVRTAPAGQRLQLDTSGLRAFNAGGAETVRLSSASGGMMLSEGPSTSPETFFALHPSNCLLARQTPNVGVTRALGISTTASGSSIDAYTNPETTTTDVGPHRVRVDVRDDRAEIRLEVIRSGGVWDPALVLQARRNGGASISADGPLKLPGETDWVYPTLLAGTNVSGNEFGYRRRNGIVYLRGRVNGLPSNATMVVLPVGFRIDSGLDNVFGLDAGGYVRINIQNTGAIVNVTGATIAGGITFMGTSFLAAP